MADQLTVQTWPEDDGWHMRLLNTDQPEDTKEPFASHREARTAFNKAVRMM